MHLFVLLPMHPSPKFLNRLWGMLNLGHCAADSSLRSRSQQPKNVISTASKCNYLQMPPRS